MEQVKGRGQSSLDLHKMRSLHTGSHEERAMAVFRQQKEPVLQSALSSHFNEYTSDWIHTPVTISHFAAPLFFGKQQTAAGDVVLHSTAPQISTTDIDPIPLLDAELLAAELLTTANVPPAPPEPINAPPNPPSPEDEDDWLLPRPAPPIPLDDEDDALVPVVSTTGGS